MYHVHSVEQDLAGKWYARVVITEDEARFFKFDHFPSMGEIQETVVSYVESISTVEVEAHLISEEATVDAIAE
jgi:hypothetical protein